MGDSVANTVDVASYQCKLLFTQTLTAPNKQLAKRWTYQTISMQSLLAVAVVRLQAPTFS